jgi:hypothetical protein
VSRRLLAFFPSLFSPSLKKAQNDEFKIATDVVLVLLDVSVKD